MPQLVTVQLSQAGLTLHLAEPCDLGPAWQAEPGQRTWTVPATVDRDSVGPAAPDQPPPWPLLVTIGNDHDGGVWLLNLEHAGVIHLTGDPVFVHDFARYLAAELACNLWSQHVLVDCIGLADEVAPMAPERISTHPPPDTRPTSPPTPPMTPRPTVGYADDEGLDLPTARAHQAGPEAWPAHALLVDLTSGQEDHPALDRLVTVIAEHPRRCGTTVVISGADPTGSDGLVLHLSRDGRLRVPTLDLDLAAVGLTADEAAGCAALLAQADDVTPDPMPRRANGDGWRTYADEAGNLRPEHAEPRRAATPPPAVTVPADSPADPETPGADARPQPPTPHRPQPRLRQTRCRARSCRRWCANPTRTTPTRPAPRLPARSPRRFCPNPMTSTNGGRRHRRGPRGPGTCGAGRHPYRSRGCRPRAGRRPRRLVQPRLRPAAAHVARPGPGKRAR